MRILLSIVIAVAVIGVIIPSVYAENTIGFPFIHYPSGLDFPIIQETVIINGHVKFENEKAVGLGLGPGYQITVQVYSSDDKLMYTKSIMLELETSKFSLLKLPLTNKISLHPKELYHLLAETQESSW